MVINIVLKKLVKKTYLTIATRARIVQMVLMSVMCDGGRSFLLFVSVGQVYPYIMIQYIKKNNNLKDHNTLSTAGDDVVQWWLFFVVVVFLAITSIEYIFTKA